MSKRRKPDFIDSKPAETLNKEQLDHIAAEIRALDAEIHQYLRTTYGPMQLALTVLGTIIGINVDHAFGIPTLPDVSVKDIVLIISPIIWATIATFNINVSSQAAVMAEIRDRLSYRLNKALKRPVYIVRVASDMRRGSNGTIAAYALAFAIMLIIIALGILNVLNRSLLLIILQAISTVISLLSVAIALYELAQSRIDINSSLDDIFTSLDRPSTAPIRKDNFFKRFVSAIRIRK